MKLTFSPSGARWVVGITVVSLCLAGLAVRFLRINMSPSVPTGIYRVLPADTILEPGLFIEFCQPVAIRKFVSNTDAGRCPDGSLPALKPVAAVAGDVVVVTDDGIAVNGVSVANSGAIAAVPHMAAGQYTVATGDLWVLSHYHPASIDSRYYGPIPSSQVLHIVSLVWEI